MWQLPNPSIKFADLRDTFFSKKLFFWSDFATSSTKIQRKRFTKLDDKLAVPFLYDQIGQNLPTNVKQTMSSHHPFIAISFKKLISRFLKGSGAGSFESLLQPMEKANVGVGNFKNASIMTVLVSIPRFVFKLTGMKTSLSIDNSSKIGKMNWIVNFWFVKIPVFMILIGEFLHKSPFSGFTNQYTHETCLNPG